MAIRDRAFSVNLLAEESRLKSVYPLRTELAPDRADNRAGDRDDGLDRAVDRAEGASL